LERVRHTRPAALVRGTLLGLLGMGAVLLWPALAQAVPPVVKATWGTEVNASSFRARGVIDTEGLTTSYRFDYITAAAYDANVGAGRPGFSGAERLPVVDAKVLGSALDQDVLQRIGGLSAETSYRFRLVAKNSSGESEGPTRTIATQEAASTFALAENRRWEMVSPVDKNGGGVAPPGELFGGGDLQAAAQGGSIAYGSASSFAAAAGAPGASQYVSTRTPFGWSTINVTLPTSAGAFGTEPDGTPYRLFSGNLTSAVALSAPHVFQSLAMDPVPRSTGSLAAPDLRLAGSTEDLTRLVFATCEALTPDALEVPGSGGCDPAFPNLYLKDASGLRLLNLQPGSPLGDPGAALAAPAGAISSSGDRVYWVDAAGDLLVRDGGRSLLVEPEATFEAASADGTIAYYTKEAHLYRYSLAAESSADLTPGGGVEGVLGASASGAYVYYLDGGGVKLWHQGATTTVTAAADASNFPPATGAARVSADGTRLVFLSSAPLLGYDPEGASQVYRYDANSGSLSCASCNPYGARPSGPSSIPGAIANGSEAAAYKPRAMDVDGSRVFFDSEDALVPTDTNGEQDVYEWRAPGVAGCGRPQGCVGLISSGTGADDAEFVDASADGRDVFFLTSTSLLPADPGAMDAYDARIGGGFPEPEPPIPCFGDDCQPLPPEPDDPTPGTQFHGSEGNPKLQIERAGKKPKGKKHHHGKRKHKRGSKRGHHRGSKR
jgi:hypothetical protein